MTEITNADGLPSADAGVAGMKFYVNLYRNPGGGKFAGTELYATAVEARRAAKNERADNWAGVGYVIEQHPENGAIDNKENR